MFFPMFFSYGKSPFFPTHPWYGRQPLTTRRLEELAGLIAPSPANLLPITVLRFSYREVENFGPYRYR